MLKSDFDLIIVVCRKVPICVGAVVEMFETFLLMTGWPLGFFTTIVLTTLFESICVNEYLLFFLYSSKVFLIWFTQMNKNYISTIKI